MEILVQDTILYTGTCLGIGAAIAVALEAHSCRKASAASVDQLTDVVGIFRPSALEIETYSLDVALMVLFVGRVLVDWRQLWLFVNRLGCEVLGRCKFDKGRYFNADGDALQYRERDLTRCQRNQGHSL